MGLDAVELLIEIEDTFSIEIPDEDASRMATVGDVHEYIVANSNMASKGSVCLSASAFRSLRRAAASLGVTDRLRPRDSIDRLLPDSGRRRFWTSLQHSAQLRLPKLRRPKWMVAAATVVVMLLTAWVGLAVYRETRSQLAAPILGVAAAMFSGWLLSVLTLPFATLPPANCATLGHLAESVLGLNFSQLAKRYHGGDSNDVWIALRAVIVEQLGVSPEVVTPTASFEKELGCG